MKEVNLNFNFVGIDGKEIDPAENAGKMVSKLLASSTGKTPVKFWGWATEFHSGQTIKMNTDDLDILRSFINDHEAVTALAKAQIIEALKKD